MVPLHDTYIRLHDNTFSYICQQDKHWYQMGELTIQLTLDGQFAFWRREQHSKLIPDRYASLSRRAAVLRRSLSMFGKESTFAGLSRTFPLVESNHAPLCQQNRSAFSPRCFRLRGPTVCVFYLLVKRHRTHKGTLWRRRWDSNPRGCYASTVFGPACL